MPHDVLRAGTRGSRLAVAQTHHVLTALEAAWPGLRTEAVPYETRGDRALGALHAVKGDKGLFTSALEDALRACEIDIAVHSLKDLPTEAVPGLTLGAVLGRTTALDALVADGPWTLDTLPDGAVVGTGSRRRTAQLLHRRPNLRVVPARGNVETRIRNMRRGDFDALVLAEAGLVRLGLGAAIASVLPPDVMLPAAGQGALAVQCRADDSDTLALLLAVDHPDARRTTTAERAFLSALGGGCSAPVGAFARAEGGGLFMNAVVASPDGRTLVGVGGAGNDARALGCDLARRALERGAAEVLADARSA